MHAALPRAEGRTGESCCWWVRQVLREGRGWSAAAHHAGGQETCHVCHCCSRRGESAHADGWQQHRCRRQQSCSVRARQPEWSLGRLVCLCCCSSPLTGQKARSGAPVCEQRQLPALPPSCPVLLRCRQAENGRVWLKTHLGLPGFTGLKSCTEPCVTLLSRDRTGSL